MKYPKEIGNEGIVVKLLNSGGHSAPLAKIKYKDGSFYIPAPYKMFEGQKINFSSEKNEIGQIMKLKDIFTKSKFYCIESRPNDGGIFIKSAGNSAMISKTIGKNIFVIMPSKKEKKFNEDCRAIIGVIAGAGKFEKPVLKAGKKYHIKKTKSKLWPRTSAVKMNAIDHPFGSGRAKNVKSKISKRNAPPGRKVGLLRPRRTGRKKK